MKTIIKILPLFLLLGCTSKTSYEIHGTFKHETSKEWVYLVRFMDNNFKLDSAKVLNGKFAFKGKINFPEVYALHPKNPNEGVFPFILEPDYLEITIDNSDWYIGSTIEGGKYNTEYKNLEDAYTTPILNLQESLKETKQKEKVSKQIDKLIQKRDEERLTYIRNNPKSPIAIYDLSKSFYFLPIDTLGVIIEKFSPEIKQTAIFKVIDEFYKTQIALKNNTPALKGPDFTPLSFKISNKSIIESLININQNKTLYIDIWATWCGACKQEFPYSIELSSKIDTSKVSMVYLCVESKEKDWRSIIEKQNLIGQHFLLSKELVTKLEKEIGKIHGIPRYVIVDKSGLISDKNAPRPSSTRLEKLLVN